MARIETDCDMYFEEAPGCQFVKDSSLVRKSLKFCKTVAVWTFSFNN